MHQAQAGSNGTDSSRPLSTIAVEYCGPRGMLLRADCLDLLANLEADSVDLAFVDPPFNLGKNYNVPGFRDSMADEAYRNWCRMWLLELVRVIRPGGALFLYHWPKWLMDLGAWFNTIPQLTYKSWIACKMKSGFPIKGRLHPAHYGLLHYVKRGAKPTFNLVRHRTPTCRKCGALTRDYGGYRDKFKKYEDEEGVPWIQISDFWEDTRPARQEKAREEQVNELPLQIPERAILMASKPGDVILDCFAGGGSTAHAAQMHDRYWIAGDFGDTRPALRRIASFIGTDEAKKVPKVLERCFDSGMRQAIAGVLAGAAVRPVEQHKPLTPPSASLDGYASKSKVLGF